MEEKRKRGRPPGRGKKPKGLSPEVKESAFVQEIKEKGFSETPNKGILAIDAAKFDPQPDNWFSMSRTEKLRWLTEHKK